MTDQTKPRMVEMLRVISRELNPNGDQWRIDADAERTAATLSHGGRWILTERGAMAVLAWSDRQSAVSATAALRMAAELADAHGPIDHDIGADILALITPAGISGLASMLEEAELRGHTRAMVEVAVSAGTHDARGRNEALEEAAKSEDAKAAKHHANSRWELAAQHDATAARIRALKSKEPGNG